MPDSLAENHYEVSSYSYVLNNPLGYTDPFGLETLSANTDYIKSYREGVDVITIDEVTVTRSLNVNEQSVDAVDQPGTAESLIPYGGSSRAAIDHFQHGNYGWRAFHTAIAVSDVFLVKSIATGLGKGTWKLGSHSWSATKNGWVNEVMLKQGNPIHHWAVPQSAAKKYGIEGVTNHPWNLMTFPNQSLHMRAGHGMNYLGQPGYGTLGQFWYGTPTWFKAGGFSGGGRIID